MPWISLVRFKRTSGVFPTRSITLSAIDVPCNLASAESSPQGMRASVPLGSSGALRPNFVAGRSLSDLGATRFELTQRPCRV